MIRGRCRDPFCKKYEFFLLPGGPVGPILGKGSIKRTPTHLKKSVEFHKIAKHGTLEKKNEKAERGDSGDFDK
jgi:hypothetical protein